MGIALFFGILSITVFYVFHLMAEPFDSRNAEEIILKQANDSEKTVSIKDRHNIGVLLDTFNKGKRMKEKSAHSLPSPAYHGYISMTDTHRVHFTVWLKKDEAVILTEGKDDDRNDHHHRTGSLKGIEGHTQPERRRQNGRKRFGAAQTARFFCGKIRETANV